MEADGDTGGTSMYKEPWQVTSDQNKMFDSWIQGTNCKGRLFLFSKRLAKVYMLFAAQGGDTLGVKESQIRRTFRVTPLLGTRGYREVPRGSWEKKLLVETALESAIKKHVRGLEAEVRESGSHIDQARPGPAGKLRASQN